MKELPLHIKITNFHNISSLEYDIADDKVNFLYGVSGSGKSSIVKGIAYEINPATDTMVGHDSDQQAVVLINGNSGPLESTISFDGERQRTLFSSSPDKGFYNIFVGNEYELDSLREEYQKAVSSLQSKTSELLRVKGNIEALAKTLGKAGKNGFTSTSKMGKAIKAYDDTSTTTRAYIERRGMSVANWIKDGFSLDESYKTGNCPFCEQQLASSPNEKALDELYSLSVKDLKPLFDSPTQLALLGQDPIDVSTDAGRAELKIL